MLELTAEKRDTKENVKRLREEGKIPAVFYGRKEKATPVAVGAGDFKRALKQAGESTVLTLKTPDKDLSVLIHDIAYEPIHGEPIHVDFYAVEADKEVEVQVPISFIGTAPAEKELGAVVVKVLHELSVSGLPKDLPHELEVDLSTLKTMDDSITAGTVKLPSGITLAEDPEDVVVALSVAEEEEEEEKAEEFDPDAVEVEGKGKEEDSETTSSEEGGEEKQ